jgi:hypothetical protein
MLFRMQLGRERKGRQYTTMTDLVFLDQNAWIALARGAWDKAEFSREHTALSTVVELVRAGVIIVPLTFANIYETMKINCPDRRANMAHTQAFISGGVVFRGRQHILEETLSAYIAQELSIARPAPAEHWFLSDLWFECASNYEPEAVSLQISQRFLDHTRLDPPRALIDYLIFNDESVRLDAIKRYSAGSMELIGRIERRRKVVSGQPLAFRKRVYGAQLLLDELDFVLATGRKLGLDWQAVGDIGSSLARSIVAQVPILNVERELVVRLEDQKRSVNENDLRDMLSFTTAIPLADVVVAENQFVNLTRQSGLGKSHGTRLITSIFDFYI